MMDRTKNHPKEKWKRIITLQKFKKTMNTNIWDKQRTVKIEVMELMLQMLDYG